MVTSNKNGCNNSNNRKNRENRESCKKRSALVLFVLLLSGAAFAKKNCTDQPKDKWMTEEAFKKMVVEQGYTIKKFKQPGSCYEIYGTDKEGKKVEIYFNPVDGTIVKSK